MLHLHKKQYARVTFKTTIQSSHISKPIRINLVIFSFLLVIHVVKKQVLWALRHSYVSLAHSHLLAQNSRESAA